MTSQRRPLTGWDAAGGGALLMAPGAMSAGAEAGLGVLVGPAIAPPPARFFSGLKVGIAIVTNGFRHL